jgi:hypothetical protein
LLTFIVVEIADIPRSGTVSMRPYFVRKADLLTPGSTIQSDPVPWNLDELHRDHTIGDVGIFRRALILDIRLVRVVFFSVGIALDVTVEGLDISASIVGSFTGAGRTTHEEDVGREHR